MTNDFENVTTYSGEPPEGEQSLARVESNPLAAINTAEQSRAVAEVAATISLARQFPRNHEMIRKEVRLSCSRLRFAEKAMYSYSRGGNKIEGLTIKAIRQIASHYGHIEAGLRELERTRTHTKLEAFAWDKFNNNRAVRQFIMRFARDVNGTVKDVTSERDKYEVAANFGMRRVRACLEQLLPAELISEAEDLVRDTLKQGDGKVPFADRVSTMIVSFDEIGVSEEALSTWCGYPIRTITPAKLVQLRQIYMAITEGVTTIHDEFVIPLVGNDKTSKEKSNKPLEPDKQEDIKPENNGSGSVDRNDKTTISTPTNGMLSDIECTTCGQPESEHSENETCPDGGGKFKKPSKTKVSKSASVGKKANSKQRTLLDDGGDHEGF